MSQDLGTQETTSVRADFLVELRGFEPLTSVVETHAATVPPLPRLNIAQGCASGCGPRPVLLPLALRAASTSNASPVSTRTMVSSSTPWPIVSAFAEEPRPLPDVEKLDFRINHIIDRALDVRLRADCANRKGTCSGAQFQLPRRSNPPRTACTTLPVLDRYDW
jgi:hypothetical protein